MIGFDYMKINTLMAPRSLSTGNPEQVPLQQVSVINLPLPAMWMPHCTKNAVGEHGRCIRQLRTVVNVTVLIFGVVIVYWTFGRPFFNSGTTLENTSGNGHTSAGSAASAALSGGSRHSLWHALLKSWG